MLCVNANELDKTVVQRQFKIFHKLQERKNKYSICKVLYMYLICL